MRNVIFVLFILACIAAAPLRAEPDRVCPRTEPRVRFDGAPFPEFGDWYGTEALAVTAPSDGIWITTAPNALIAVKLFWWSAGFQVGMEHNLDVTITNVFDRGKTIDVGRATNAGDINMIGEANVGRWAMLVGIDIKEAGCWEVKGEYLGQTLTFVVETILYEDWKAAQDE